MRSICVAGAPKNAHKLCHIDVNKDDTPDDTRDTPLMCIVRGTGHTDAADLLLLDPGH